MRVFFRNKYLRLDNCQEQTALAGAPACTVTLRLTKCKKTPIYWAVPKLSLPTNMLGGNNLKHSSNLNTQRCITLICHISLCSFHSQMSGNQSDTRSLKTFFAETDSPDVFTSRLSHKTRGITELTFFPGLC